MKSQWISLKSQWILYLDLNWHLPDH